MNERNRTFLRHAMRVTDCTIDKKHKWLSLDEKPAAYALIFPNAIYLGSTKNLRIRIRRHFVLGLSNQSYREKKSYDLYCRPDWNDVQLEYDYYSTVETAQEVEALLSWLHRNANKLNKKPKAVQRVVKTAEGIETAVFLTVRDACKQLGLKRQSVEHYCYGRQKEGGNKNITWSYL